MLSTSSMLAESKETQKLSKLFHTGDIVFCSSDNVLFYIQQKFLEAHAEGFSLTGYTTSSNEIVSLTEPSSVLEILFQFAWPYMPPDLDDLDFKLLMQLAEAAEKYLLHHLRKFCIIEMR
ncbi:hypothetical protein VKT23_016057 [Stygiomarasmius scandens]|uniref:BTB domain-containing protein n=1 Tax=Marasmiellus scandens TaxID=2682957 RepID=A0ABR1IY65_9AGAR